MSNPWFQFKQFTIQQDRCAMKVTTDACLFGGYVSHQLQNLNDKPQTILDIGTGTGLLTLMLAQQSNSTIDAIEKDKDAFEQATQNIAASPWAYRIKSFYGDARDFDFPSVYDLIISNPPFYENELKSDNAKKNIALHNEGLLLDELLQIIRQTLKPEGSFYILLPFKRNDETEKLCAENKLSVVHKIFVRQSTKHSYFRIILSGKHQHPDETEFSTSEISIWNNKQQYTGEFIELLKDYYLYL